MVVPKGMVVPKRMVVPKGMVVPKSKVINIHKELDFTTFMVACIKQAIHKLEVIMHKGQGTSTSKVIKKQARR